MSTGPTAVRPDVGSARRRLTGRSRRMLRAVHVLVAGGWLGLVVAMLALGASALAAPRETTYLMMHLIGGRVIPPMAVATLGTGVVLSLWTPWGLVQHWWVVAKIVVGLAVIVSAVTLTGGWIERSLDAPMRSGPAGVRLVATSIVHTVLLAFATVISVDKPWGRTPHGRRTSRRDGPG